MVLCNTTHMYLMWSVDLLQLVCKNYMVNISKLVCNICRQISQEIVSYMIPYPRDPNQRRRNERNYFI